MRDGASTADRELFDARWMTPTEFEGMVAADEAWDGIMLAAYLAWRCHTCSAR